MSHYTCCNVWLTKWEVRLWEVRLWEVRLREVRLREVRLREVRLREVRLREVRLREVRLREVRLREVRLREVRLWEVRLWEVRLWEVRLWEVEVICGMWFVKVQGKGGKRLCSYLQAPRVSTTHCFSLSISKRPCHVNAWFMFFPVFSCLALLRSNTNQIFGGFLSTSYVCWSLYKPAGWLPNHLY